MPKLELDDLLQQAVDMIESERSLRWARADLFAHLLDVMVNEMGMRRQKAAALLGSVVDKSAHWVYLEERMSLTYPPDYRHLDVDPNIYRACLGSEDPIAMLNQAMNEEWSTKDIKAAIDEEMGKVEEKKTRLVLRGKLDWPSHQGDIVLHPEDVTEMTLPQGLLGLPVRAIITG